jgi:hypothetical protein
MSLRFLLFFISISTFAGCQVAQKTASLDLNPAATGFNAANSDPKAIEIADAVMKAMGGRKNWDNTHFLTWNFFGKRTLVWDKWSGDVRIEMPAKEMTILMNVNTGKGTVQQQKNALTQPDSLAKYLKIGKETWINDSYWLVMPFKLKDSGVTLKYMGDGKTEVGGNADVLQLTFDNVGVTPQNKYLIYVDKSSHLVTQWSFFGKNTDEAPKFTTPWANYFPYGKVILSFDRGNDRKLSNIYAYDKLPKEVFTTFAPINVKTLWDKQRK